MASQGRQGAIADLPFDVALDSSVFEGVEGIDQVVRGIHICRGNAAGTSMCSC
jgi:hypothetical protein